MEKVAPEFTLEAFADPASVRDVVRGILHTIFFLRYFVSHEPKTRDVCGLELAYIPDAEIETLIDQRVATLVRQLEVDRNQSSSSQHPYGGGGPGYSGGGGGRGQITVQFFEKKRRKTWYGMGRGDDEVCWENWTVKVTVAEPRTESERHKVRNAMESTLQSTVFKCITIANTHKDHIPPITTNDSNPFTYQIHVNPHHGLHVTSQQHLQSAASKEAAAARSDFGSSGNGGSSSGTGGSGRGVGRGGAGGLAGAAGGAAAAVVGSWATRMGIYWKDSPPWLNSVGSVLVNVGLSVRDAAVRLDEACGRTLDRWDREFQYVLDEEEEANPGSRR